jgi:protein subunit release factor A
MVGLYKDPEGEKIFSRASMGTPSNTQFHMTAPNEVDTLRQRIRELEEELKEKVVPPPPSLSLPLSLPLSPLILSRSFLGEG